MIFSREELILLNEALVKAKSQSETSVFETEKRILDSYGISLNENANAIIQELYTQLSKKIDGAIEEMKNA